MLENLAKQGLPFFESEEELLSYVRKLQEPKKVESDKDKEPNKEQEDLQKKIKALTKQLDKTEKEKIELIESNKRREQEFKTKQREEKLTELLTTELKKAKCNSVELLREHPSLRRRVEIDDDGFVIIKNKKGEEIGDENSFPDLIQEYKESNPQLFTVVQAINNKNNTTKKIFDINNGGVERPRSLHEQRGRLVAAIQNEFGAKLTKGG
jgi:phage pi2 protein 07